MRKCVNEQGYLLAGMTCQNAVSLHAPIARVGIALNVLGGWRPHGCLGRKLEFASSGSAGTWWISSPSPHTRGFVISPTLKPFGDLHGQSSMPQSSGEIPTWSISSYQRGTRTVECIFMRFGQQASRKSGSKTTRALVDLGIRRRSRQSKAQPTPPDMLQNTLENL